jgi:hypothetical protein
MPKKGLRKSDILRAVSSLSAAKKQEILLFLLRRSYVAELRTLDAISGRRSTYRPSAEDKSFKRMLDQCVRNKVNPFHVIRTAFGQRQLGDMAPTPSGVFDIDMLVQYAELSTAWDTVLMHQLQCAWRSYRIFTENLADTLGCEMDEAIGKAIDDGTVSDIFAYSFCYSRGIELPLGVRDEVLREYCLSPVAYARAASAIGMQLPPEVTKYGPIARQAGENIAS